MVGTIGTASHPRRTREPHLAADSFQASAFGSTQQSKDTLGGLRNSQKIYAGELLNAALTPRFEGIQARRDKFNREFKVQITLSGSREFGSFSLGGSTGPRRSSKTRAAPIFNNTMYASIDGTGNSSAFRQISSPAETNGRVELPAALSQRQRHRLIGDLASQSVSAPEAGNSADPGQASPLR